MEETGRRTAAVRAVTETRVIALDREDFSTLVGAMPGLVKQT
jgi:CRP-like cAMP-binding protein